MNKITGFFPEKVTNRVLRGGSWNNNPRNCRVANRNNDNPSNSNSNYGFRLVSSSSKYVMDVQTMNRKFTFLEIFQINTKRNYPLSSRNCRNPGSFFRYNNVENVNTRKVSIALLVLALCFINLIKIKAQSSNILHNEKRLALVVGNNNYPVRPLNNAVNDARAIKNALNACGFTVLPIVENASQEELELKIADFSKSLKDYDVGLFYFSGHGMEVNGQNYILPTSITAELSYEDVKYKCTSMEWVQNKMAATGSHNKTFIIILDACRDNPFATKAFQKSTWKSGGDIPSGMITCYATSSGKTSFDGGPGQNGEYTSALLKHLNSPGLNIEQVFKKVRIELKNNGLQEPLEQTSLTKEFYFVPKDAPNQRHIEANIADTDADGIPDSEDGCPTRYGTKANKGCPQEASGTDDYDRDGISDSVDPCPSDYGTANGCPDADKDGVPDKSDRCTSLAGKPEWEGCPDTDSDGIPDHLDKCPQEFGSKSYNGCAPSKTTPTASSMVSIPASSNVYKMGNVFHDPDDNDENISSVSLSPIVMDKYETTFAEYDKFCDETGKEKPDDQGWGRGKRPVINVRWYDAIEYANWRSEQEGKTPCYTIDKYTKDPNNKNENGNDGLKWKVSCNWQANGYRLPTSTEWEYAASWDPIQQKKSRFGNGKDIANPTEMNFDTRVSYKENYSNAGEYRDRTLEVGSFQSNAMGLFDMAGNVWEWCWDWYDAKNPEGFNPKGALNGTSRVLRGGSWGNCPRLCRAALRGGDFPGNSDSNCGFRLVSSSL